MAVRQTGQQLFVISYWVIINRPHPWPTPWPARGRLGHRRGVTSGRLFPSVAIFFPSMAFASKEKI